MVKKIFQAATAENDNPDVRDRAYVYWRLLSSSPQIAQNVVLSDKPPITTNIQSLPPALLEQLLGELSTLASVYHKPPETFIGQGRYGADAVQKAAIEEQMQNARENPLAAAAAAAAVAGTAAPAQSNIENLLDIDFDGAAPASVSKEPAAGLSGLEGLAGTPQRVASPAASNRLQQSNSGLDDLMGLSAPTGGFGGMSDSQQDILNGFAGLDISGASQPPPPQQQLASGGSRRTNEDLLSLF